MPDPNQGKQATAWEASLDTMANRVQRILETYREELKPDQELGVLAPYLCLVVAKDIRK